MRDTCPDVGASSSSELWRVLASSGEQVMTLEELDKAFDAGQIDASTLVCAPGSLQFGRLGALAGLDADAAGIEVEVEVDFDAGPPLRVPSDAVAVTELAAPAFRRRWSFRQLLAVPALAGVIVGIVFATHASASSEVAVPPSSEARAELSAPVRISPPAQSSPVSPPPSEQAAASAPRQEKKALPTKDKKAEASPNAKRGAVAPHHPAAAKARGAKAALAARAALSSPPPRK